MRVAGVGQPLGGDRCAVAGHGGLHRVGRGARGAARAAGARRTAAGDSACGGGQRLAATPILVAELDGPDPDGPFVLYSGHNDTWYYGVMDNGAANATMLELARLLAPQREKWRRGLRLWFWSGHSHERYSGSTWYAEGIDRDAGLLRAMNEGDRVHSPTVLTNHRSGRHRAHQRAPGEGPRHH
ncbi:MAG TPA: M28 family peptidase [Acetobacteraceae bacterium]|nr:M28 family peptidase [Acetobacteraceae bacterium]